jgi:aspartyl-tRNA(Asn)/glutamyl-tRNA(Gln) amidotransferase subunit C
MSLNSTQIQQIAQLARLELLPEQTDTYASQLSSIFSLVERLSSVQTADVSPMAHPLEMTQRLRPDVVSAPNQREAFQAIAPAAQDGLYLVPRVIE